MAGLNLLGLDPAAQAAALQAVGLQSPDAAAMHLLAAQQHLLAAHQGGMALPTLPSMAQPGSLTLSQQWTGMQMQQASSSLLEPTGASLALGGDLAALGGVPAAVGSDLAAKQQAVDPDAPKQPPPALPDQKILAIAENLIEAGGVLPLGKLTGTFPGLKRSQLEGVFDLAQIGGHRQWEVRLPGTQSKDSVMMYGGEPIGRDVELPSLTEEQISQISALLQGHPLGILPLSRVIQQVPGIKRQQVEEHFEISVSRLDRKRYHVRMKGTPNPFEEKGEKGKGKGKGDKGGASSVSNAQSLPWAVEPLGAALPAGIPGVAAGAYNLPLAAPLVDPNLQMMMLQQNLLQQMAAANMAAGLTVPGITGLPTLTESDPAGLKRKREEDAP